MLSAIRKFFDTALATPTDGGDRHSIEVATAALLIEIVRMDGEAKPDERDAVLRAVRGRFGLSAEDAQALIDLAETEARQANDYYQFTSVVNQRFSHPQKIRVVELLWEVAYSDATIDPLEEHLIRKLADLLHVEHRDYITAKLRARDAAAGQGGR